MLKKLLSDTAWYGLSSIVGRLINYAMVPLFTAVLPVASNGVITTLYAYAAFLNVVLTFGMETAYFRFGRGPAADEQLQAARGQTLIAGTSLVFLVLLWLAMPWLQEAIAYPALPTMAYLMATFLITDALAAIPLARLRLQGKAKLYATYKLVPILLYVGLSSLFLLAPGMLPGLPTLGRALGVAEQPVIWVLLANLLANAPLLALVGWRHFKPGLLATPAGYQMVRYAWPIVVMGLAGMANQLLGILQLERLLPAGFYPGLSNTEAVGVYGQCYKLSIFMALVVQAFRLGAEPFFFSLADKAHKEQGFALVMRWFVLACIGVLVLVCINLDWIAPLVLRRPIYLTGLGVVPTLLTANLFLGVYYNLSVWFKLTDQTAWGTWLSLGGLVATVSLNYLLIPAWGYQGAAAATLICYLAMAIASYGVGQRYMPVPYPTVWILAGVGVAYTASALFPWLVRGLPAWQVWAFRMAYAGAYLAWVATEFLKLRRRPAVV